MSNIQFNVCNQSDNVDERVRSYNNTFSSVLDKHAPIKHRVARKNPPPYMNHELKKAIYKKCMLRNKFYKNKSDINWEMYKTQRNTVTNIRRNSIRHYFVTKTEGLRNPGDFWKVMKPFITDKNSISDDHIILRENDVLVTDTLEVCNVFNNYFVNVAETIGFEDKIPLHKSSHEIFNYIVLKYANHSSIQAIKQRSILTAFNFENTCEEEVGKIILKLDTKNLWDSIIFLLK